MAALAFISYTGNLLKGDDRTVERVLTPCLVKELQKQPLTHQRYDLVWGVFVYKFELAELDDNMMFIVRDRHNSKKLVIAIRGTNGTGLLDWIAEDFDVGVTKKWTYGHIPQGLNPAISRATHTGLDILRTAKPARGIPGAGLTVREFLQQQVSKQDIDEVYIVGHSLAGTLSPTFALWLDGTRKQWDPSNSVTLKVTALAGATPGNKDFADWYDQQLGKTTRRLHNPYDVVPLAWTKSTMLTIPGLYAEKGIEANFLEKEAVHLGIKLSQKHNYTQILVNEPSLSGKVYSGAESFIKQVAWQHQCGYYCALGIADKMQTVSENCKDFTPQLSCPVCP